jgi:hypothetical protein
VLRKSQNNVCQDTPDLADEYTCEVKQGDIIVSATDGVFDNLFLHEVFDLIKKYKQERYEIKRAQYNPVDHSHMPCFLSSREEADELASRVVKAARAKVDAKKGSRVSTPY